MFRIVCDPSSGSTVLCLTEITLSGSQIVFVRYVHRHRRFKITLPNTDQAHEKYLWTTKSNFSQAQLSASWWWIAHDPKHVGVIFNCLLKLTARRTVHTHSRFKITLPNTDQAHEKYLWTTKSNFSQAQLSTPWWWIAHDPKHVGVISNCHLKLTQRRF